MTRKSRSCGGSCIKILRTRDTQFNAGQGYVIKLLTKLFLGDQTFVVKNPIKFNLVLRKSVQRNVTSACSNRLKHVMGTALVTNPLHMSKANTVVACRSYGITRLYYSIECFKHPQLNSQLISQLCPNSGQIGAQIGA